MAVPNIIIPVEDANDMFVNFSRTVNSNKDSQFVTLNYQELKDYIAFIDSQVKNTNIKVEGLRFYFGKYPNGSLPSGRIPSNPDSTTFFINPTTKFPNIQGDISFAISQGIGAKKAIAVGDIINKKSLGTFQSLSANKGQFPPPPHAGDTNDYH